MLIDSIVEAQAQRGWNDGDLCRQMGVSQSVWSRIRRGLRPLDNVPFLRAVARVLPELKWQVAEYILEGGNTDNADTN